MTALCAAQGRGGLAAGVLLRGRRSRHLAVRSLGPPPLGERLAFSTVVVDRDGRLLRPYATAEGRWRLPRRPRCRSALSRDC